MPLNRRQLMTAALATVAATTAAGRWPATATAAEHRVRPTRGGHYSPNAAPLHPTAFLRLPPGRVTARGWLAVQLKLQLDGLCGRYEEFSHFLDFSATGWVRPELGGWEEVPYWLRGHTDLAIVTGDAKALAAVRRWFDAILATQQSDGFFGPGALRISLNGGPDFWPFLPLVQALRSWQEYTGDARIIPFLSRFFRYMNAQGPGAFNTSWIALRRGDGLDSVFWLYNRTGDVFLLDLADKIHTYGADWGDNLVDPHNVNIAQGFREPAQYALRSGSAQDTRDTYGTYGKAMDLYGQFPGGGFAGDENARPGHGDPLWADRCEELAFNSLPASLDPSGRAVHYITSANSVDLDNVPKSERQFQNGFAMQAFLPGVDQYRCCPHNYGMGRPYFTEETDYPFTDAVTLTLKAPKRLAFPLVLRVPAWCDAPGIAVNGRRVDAPAGPAFTRVDRTWSDGDRVTLRFPQRIGGSDRFPEYAVHATGPWNYGLVLDAEKPAASLRHHSARRIPEWTADDEHVVAPLQDSPAHSTEPVEEVTLVPMGAARPRITSFPGAEPGAEPWLADRWYRIRNHHSGKVLGVDSMSLDDSAHVVQFDDNGTDDHLWQLV
ncbi:glycoside hydrolase family 127 protein [Streptomyces sp. NBC_00726]